MPLCSYQSIRKDWQEKCSSKGLLLNADAAISEHNQGHKTNRKNGNSGGKQSKGNGACRGHRFSINGMEEALEIPVLNDLTMVLGSIAQSRATEVVVDFSEPSTVYDNVKQAVAFGLNSVVYVPNIELDTVTELSAFCEKASMASFHYNSVEIVESRPNPSDLPSQDAIQIANNISDLGQIYNREDMDSDNPARGQILGEDGVRVHSMVLPGLASSTSINFSGPGEIYTLRHDVTNVQCMMPGLILAIRKVVRLKNLIYGLEKFL
uniref:Dihydrodipicolinate reductase C-terminal domain-containing protein n=1 Tax=Oryza meridionalis TaxID=40149 RepID=A0A0E0CU60_9ORYZ